MSHGAGRGKWRPEPGAETRRHSLEQMRVAIVECLVEARGGTYADQSRYLD